jgi:hypothetical protein
LTFTTPAVSAETKNQAAGIKNGTWGFDLLKMPGISEQGTVNIRFIAGSNGLIPSIESKMLSLKANKWPDGKMDLRLKAGGPVRRWIFESPLEEGENATLVFRWRRFPLTREVLLVAQDGTEFTLVADVRTPWEEMILRDGIKVSPGKSGKILSAVMSNDAAPASEPACLISVPEIDKKVWRTANG